MKKLYVDEIISKIGLNEPGPATYETKKSFGELHGSYRYSMRLKNDMFALHLNKQKKLPGPTSYFNTVNLAGRSLSNSKYMN
jgi:hypothetical protein